MLMRSYAPALPLVLYALLVMAGADHVALLIPFLLVQAGVTLLYVHDTREHLRDDHKKH